jgi:hypothetical protein
VNGYLLSDYKALNDEERRAVNEAYDTLIGGDEELRDSPLSIDVRSRRRFEYIGDVPKGGH